MHFILPVGNLLFALSPKTVPLLQVELNSQPPRAVCVSSSSKNNPCKSQLCDAKNKSSTKQTDVFEPAQAHSNGTLTS